MGNYWKIGCNWGPGAPDFYDLLKKHSIIVYADKSNTCIGDIVAITKGYNVVAIAEIIGEKKVVTEFNELENEFSQYKIDYDDWVFVAKSIIYELEPADQFKYELRQGFCRIQKNEIIKQLDSIYMKIEKKKAMNDYVTLLKNNHNLILTGAPGTGKTYLAKQIAQQMIFDEVKNEMTKEEKQQFYEQYEFVQFHPSYDYTDFVEGLRPTPPNEDGNVGFELIDGVFKEFCKKALKYDFDFDECYKELCNKIIFATQHNMPFTLQQKSGNKTAPLMVNDKENIKWETQGGDTDVNTVSSERLKKLYSVYDSAAKLNRMANIVDEIKAVIGGCNATYYWAVLNWMLKNKKDFVFVIDEINRGEISKIFGELFFSIDPGYRGKNGKVRTQYANMLSCRNYFDEALGITKSGIADCYGHFYIPKNVYVIGTMNDIDRSVESMDFAFRRRFAFKEVTAEESQAMLDSDEAWKGKKPDDTTISEIKKRMDNLNKIIWHKKEENEKDEDPEKKSIEGLSSAYHIGASYFLKLANYKISEGEYNYEDLWDYHLKGLLFEYLRGMQDVEGKMEKLHNAYKNDNPKAESKPIESKEDDSTSNSGQPE